MPFLATLSLYVQLSHPDRRALQRTNLEAPHRVQNQVCFRIHLAFEIGLLAYLALAWLVRLAGGAVSVEAPDEGRRNQVRRSRGSTTVNDPLAMLGEPQG